MVSRSSPPAESEQHQLETQEPQSQGRIKTGALQQETCLRNDSQISQQWRLKPETVPQPIDDGCGCGSTGQPKGLHPAAPP
jgi:hypothetical protein